MSKINIFLGILILGLGLSSCHKDAPHGPHPFTIKMTDAPGPYDAVFIDLQAVEITGSGGKTVMVNANPGIYNLIDLSNGVDTLIASGSLEDAKIEQIRLILGPNNSVQVNNVNYPLSTPSAEQSGLKLQVHATLKQNILYSILLDFDANQSIVQEGNGSYKLKPVIRTIVTSVSGNIQGKISIAGVSAVVTATSSTGEKYSSNVNALGDFMIKGLPSGIYVCTITPALPLTEVTVLNVNVTAGATTDIGTIFL